MLVDLNKLRPNNETYEHYLLKQVGRAWLFKKGLRQIACEVLLNGQDVSPFGKKQISDVVGIERKRKQQPNKTKMYMQIYNEAIKIAIPLGLTEEGFRGKIDFVSTYRLRGEEKAAKEVAIESCFEKACENFNLPKDAYKKLRNPYKEEYLLVSIECKQSISDFRNGFCVSGDHSYVLAPKGLVPVEELPSKVGLLEFDFDKFHETRDWESALTVKKRPKKQYDSMFLKDPSDPKSVDLNYHEEFCKELVFSIAQEATEESVFWNPFLRNIPDGGSNNPEHSRLFKYKVGDVTPKGIVIDRRIGEKKKAELEWEKNQPMRHFSSRYTSFYKLVVPNEGITKWVSQWEIDLHI